jgi:chromosome partitioning protein
MITTIINLKGGVGKTTTAVNLADGLARRDNKTLLIDLDSQSNASVSLGFDKENLPSGVAEMLFEDLPARKAIQSAGRENFDIIVGSKQLANADVMLSDQIGREAILKKRLKFVVGNYDNIIIDTPPSLGLLPVNALVATDNYLIPVSPTHLAVQGIERILDAVQQVKEGMEIDVPLFGLLLTMCDMRSKATKEAISQVRDTYAGKVFESEIRVNTRLNEAQGEGETIYEYAPNSTGAKYYEAFVEEYIGRI